MASNPAPRPEQPGWNAQAAHLLAHAPMSPRHTGSYEFLTAEQLTELADKLGLMVKPKPTPRARKEAL